MNLAAGFQKLWNVEHRLLSSIFFIAVLVTLIFWAVLPNRYRENESTDYLTFYEPVARNLLAGEGFITSNDSPAIRYPPGFPLLLAGALWTSKAGIGSESQAVMGLILVCVGITALFVSLLGRAVGGAVVGWASALLWITYPFGLWLSKQPNSEIPFLAFFMPGIYFSWLLLQPTQPHPWKTAFLAGSLLACAMLIRPYAVGLPFILVVFILIFHPMEGVAKRLHIAGILMGSVILIVLPWQLWASGQTSEMVILSSGGMPSVRDGLTFAVNDAGYREQVSLPPDVVTLMARLEIRSRAGVLDSWVALFRVLGQEMTAQPITLLKLAAIKTLRSWYATDSGQLDGAILVFQMGYLAVALFGAGFAWRHVPPARLFILFAGAIGLYFLGMTILALSILRYMIPAMCLLLILASFGVYRIRRGSFQ